MTDEYFLSCNQRGTTGPPLGAGRGFSSRVSAPQQPPTLSSALSSPPAPPAIWPSGQRQRASQTHGTHPEEQFLKKMYGPKPVLMRLKEPKVHFDTQPRADAVTHTRLPDNRLQAGN